MMNWHSGMRLVQVLFCHLLFVPFLSHSTQMSSLWSKQPLGPSTLQSCETNFLTSSFSFLLAINNRQYCSQVIVTYNNNNGPQGDVNHVNVMVNLLFTTETKENSNT